MTPETVLTVGKAAIEITLLMAAPPLLAALLMGLLISVFQAATQINEMTLSFIPKLVAIFVVLVVFGPWMLSLLVDYTRNLIGSIPTLIG